MYSPAFPKPEKKVKEKKYIKSSKKPIRVNPQPKRAPSIMNNEEVSYLSGKSSNLQKHEPCGGNNRRCSMEDGLWMNITDEEHKLHETDHGERLNALLKCHSQLCYLISIGNIDEFMQRYGKNYFEWYKSNFACNRIYDLRIQLKFKEFETLEVRYTENGLMSDLILDNGNLVFNEELLTIIEGKTFISSSYTGI